MEFLRHFVVLIHLVGFALLFGAWAVEAVTTDQGITVQREPRSFPFAAEQETGEAASAGG